MTAHTKNPLRRSGIAKVLNLPLAVSTPKTPSAERLVSSENSKVLNLVPTCRAAVCALVTDQRPVCKQKKVGI